MKEEQKGKENQFYLSFMISGAYLVIVGLAGSVFNIIAFIKASQVSENVKLLNK